MTQSSKGPQIAIVYVRVSTAEQVESGASLDAQTVALIAEAERRGYVAQVVREEGISGKSISKRPALMGALEALKTGKAHALIALRVDRVSRSVVDFSTILEASNREGWALILPESDVDTASPSGRFLLSVLASAAQFERDLIAQRTKEALAQRKREGMTLGRPQRQPALIVERVASERAAGKSLRAIAAGLTADGIPTSQGGKAWHASTISKVLARVAA